MILKPLVYKGRCVEHADILLQDHHTVPTSKEVSFAMPRLVSSCFHSVSCVAFISSFQHLGKVEPWHLSLRFPWSPFLLSVHVCVMSCHVCMCICVHVWGLESSVFLYCSSPYFLKQVLSLNLEVTSLARQAGQPTL